MEDKKKKIEEIAKSIGKITSDVMSVSGEAFNQHLDGCVEEKHAKQLPKSSFRNSVADPRSDLRPGYDSQDQRQSEFRMQVSLQPVLRRPDKRRRHHHEQAGRHGGHDIQPEEHGKRWNEDRPPTNPEQAGRQPGDESKHGGKHVQPNPGRLPF